MNKIRVAKRLNYFEEYIFSKLQKEISKVEAKSARKVLNFAIGNPDFTPSPLYLDKLCELIRAQNAHLYPGFGANNQFADALIGWYQKRFSVSLEKEEVFPLSGAKDGVSHLPLALLNESDEVLVPDPGYPAFTAPSLMVGAKPIYYDLLLDHDFKISLDQLESKISTRTKFIWVNFPSNPTGQVATLSELEKIVGFAKANNLLIVYDNAYSEITFDGFIAPSILQIKGAKACCVEIGSLSKTFSFAAFRVGWIVGNLAIIKALAKVKSQMDSGLPAYLQNLTAFALTNFDQDWYGQMIDSYQKRREIIEIHLNKLGLIPHLPKGGLYIWAEIPKQSENSQDYAMEILHHKQILFTPGLAFGKNGKRFVRVSISTKIDKIAEYF